MEIEPALPCVVDQEEGGGERLNESGVAALLVPVFLEEADRDEAEANG